MKKAYSIDDVVCILREKHGLRVRSAVVDLTTQEIVVFVGTRKLPYRAVFPLDYFKTYFNNTSCEWVSNPYKGGEITLDMIID